MINSIPAEDLVRLHDHWQYPRNVGKSGKFQANYQNSCGDVVTVGFDLANGQITDLSWFGHGCFTCMAVASILAEHFDGAYLSTFSGPGRIEPTVAGIWRELSLTVTKLDCAMVPVRAFYKALENPLCEHLII